MRQFVALSSEVVGTYTAIDDRVVLREDLISLFLVRMI
jgi:hypothetical protein